MRSKAMILSLIVVLGSMTGSMLSWASTELPKVPSIPAGAAMTQIHRLPSQESTTRPGSQTPTYGQREAAAQDLRDFVGGQEVVIFTPYDYHILGVLILVTAIVLVVILI